jgi:hypothetical protein
MPRLSNSGKIRRRGGELLLIIRCGILGLSSELLLDLGKWMQGEKAPASGEAFAKMKEY